MRLYEQIDFVMNDGEARAKYLARKRGNIAEKSAEDSKRKREIEKRIDDLGKLIAACAALCIHSQKPRKIVAE